MDPGELRRLWEEAGGDAASPPAGPGLFGLPIGDDPGALAGAALAAVGFPVGELALSPSAVRAASSRYAGWAARPGVLLLTADYGDIAVAADDLAVSFMCAHERLADIVAAGATPLVLGGDGLVSLPVLQVLSGKLRGRLGIVAFTPTYDIAPA